MSETYDIMVTGGSSPLGDHVLPALLATGAKIAVTARNTAAADRLARSGCVAIVPFDLEGSSHLTKIGARILLHMAGIRYATGASMLAEEVGAEKIVAISSASATAPEHPLRDSILRWEGDMERSLAQLSVLRPTMIYGSSRDNTIQRLHWLTQRIKAVPRVSGGGFVMPVLVDDVVSAVLETIALPEPVRRPVGGPHPVRIGDILDALCWATGTFRLPLTIPLAPVVKAAKLGGTRPGRTRHAVQMLGADRVVPRPSDVGFRYAPTPLQEGVELAISRYQRRKR